MTSPDHRFNGPSGNAGSSGGGVRSLAINSAYLTAARIGTQVVRLVYMLAIARLLGPELYGLLAYGQSWYMGFFPIAVLGLGAVISREVGRDRSNAAPFLATTLTLRIGASGLAAGLAALLGWHLEAGSLARHLLLVFSLALVGRALAMWAEHVFVAHERSGYALLQAAVFRPLEVAVGIGLLLGGHDVLSLAILHAVTWWLQAFAAFAVVRYRLIVVPLSFDRIALARTFRLVLPIAIGAFLAGWLMQGPLVLYRHQSGVTAQALGQLALLMQIISVLATIPWSIGMAALPFLARAADRQDQKDILYLETMTRAAILGGGLIGILGLALAGPVIVWVFGDAYRNAGALLGPALWLLIPLTVGTAASSTLLARGRRWSIAVAAFLGLAVLVSLTPLLVTTFGPGGSLLATGTSLSTWALALYAVVAHRSPLRTELTLFRSSGTTLAAIAAYLLLELYLSTPAALVLSFGCFFTAAWWFRILDTSERAHARAALRLARRI